MVYEWMNGVGSGRGDVADTCAVDRRRALTALGVAAGGALLASASASAAEEAGGKIEKQTPSDDEPTAAGYPCIVRKRDIEAAKRKQLGQVSSGGTPPKETPETRVLAGCGLYFSNGLYWWYSNANSSDFCSTAYLWKSGYVIQYQFLGVCGANGLNSYDIWVSDL